MIEPKAVPSEKIIAQFTICLFRIAVLMAVLAGPNVVLGQYPDVHEEHFHRPLLEHGAFRYLDVFASPGDTTAMHSHRLPILYLCILGTEVWLDEEGTDQRRVELPTGWIGSNMYSDSSVFNHRFAVVGDSDLHIIAVERMKGAYPGGPKNEREAIFAENGFEVYSLSGENLHSSGKNQEVLSAIARWPAVIFKGSAASPSGKKHGPGDLLPPRESDGVWSFSPDAVLWIVVPVEL